MKFLKIAWRDISSIFRNRFIRISVVAIVVVPLLYSLLYLAAFWDPYGKLQNMPVAVVNLDEGAVKDEAKVNYGNDVVDRLKKNSQVGWKFVSYDDADKGVKGKKYYAEFVIPKDFSKKIVGVKDGKLDHPSILYRDNEKANFLAGQINVRVALELKDEVNKNITSEMTKVAFDSLDEVKTGFSDAADGSKQLKDGIDTAKGGTQQLADGTGQLNSKIPELSNGVTKLNNGSKSLSSALLLEKNGLTTLNGGIQDASTRVLNLMNGLGSNDIFTYASNPSNIKSAKQLMTDTAKLQKADVSGLSSVGTMLTPSNLQVLQDLMNNVSGIDMTKVNALLANANVSQDQIDKINNLLKDTGSLATMDTSKLDALAPILSNAGEIRNILNQASGLATVDTASMSTFIDKQITNISTYDTQTAALRNVDTKNALEAAIDKAYPTNVNPMLDAANAQLKQAVAGYYNTVVGTEASLQANSSTLNNMKTTISSLAGVQNTLKNDSALITGMGYALSDDNVKSLQTMITTLKGMQTELAANSQSITKIQGLLANINAKDVASTLTKINNIQSDLAKAQPLIATLSNPKMQAQLAAAPQLLTQLSTMKTDLDNNQKLLEVAQSALSDNNISQAQAVIATIPSYKDKITQLSKGTAQLNSGIYQIYDGSQQLSNGTSTLNSSVPALSTGVSKLNDGASKLNSGLLKLSDGAGTLNSGLKDGSDKIASNLKNSSSDMGSYISEPAQLNESPLNHIKNYGTGFAPYFIPLALWVGAIMMFFIITDKVDNDINANSASVVAGKYISYCFIGTLQAVLVSAAVLCLGLRPSNIVLYFLFNIFMSYVFIAIIQCLVFLLGMAGRLLSIVLLMLQLTSCAGTFPLEIIPKFFKVLYPFMPFTYCVTAIRETITNTNYAVFSSNVGVLAGILVAFLVISVVFKGHADKVQTMIKEKQEEMAGVTA